MIDDEERARTIDLSVDITTAWLANPNTRAAAEDVPAFLNMVHAVFADLAAPRAVEVSVPAPEYAAAVSVRKSLASRDHIVSMIDGKPYKTLKRHLSSHGLTPDQYRQRYGLKSDYPMVAESYSESRRETAKRIGLGRKPRSGGTRSKRAGATATRANKPKR